MYVMVREYVWTLKSIVDFNRGASYTVSRDLGTDRSPDSIHDQVRALPDQQLFLAERHCWTGVSALSTSNMDHQRVSHEIIQAGDDVRSLQLSVYQSLAPCQPPPTARLPSCILRAIVQLQDAIIDQ